MVDGKGEAAVQRDRLDLEKRKKHERQAWFGWAGSTRVRLVINVLAGLLLLVSLHWAITHAVAFVFATTAQGRGSASTLTTVPVLLWSEPDADNETLPGPRTLPGHTLDDEELQNATESLQLESATREYAASAARDPGALNDDPRHLHTYVDVHGDFGPGEDGKARLLKYKTASAAVDEPGVSLTHGCPDMRFGASCKVHLCTTRAYLPGRNFLARARNRDDHDGAWFRRKALLRLMLRGREYGYAASQTQDQQEIPRHVRPVVYQLDPALGLNEHLLGLTRVLAQALKEDRPLAVLDPNHAWATRHAQNDRNHKHPDVNLGICSTIGVNMSTVGGKHRTLPRRFDCFVNPLPFYTASIVRFGHFAALTRPPDDTNDEFGESAATSVATLLRIRHGDGSDSTTAGAIAASHVLRADHQHPPPPRMWYAQPPPMAPWNSNSWTAQPPPPPRPGFNQGKAMTAAAAADYEATRDLLDRFDAISARQAVREAENATESDVDGDNLWQDDENMEQLRQNFGMKNSSAEKLVVTKDAPTMGDDDHSFSEDLGLPGRRRQLLKKKNRMPSPPPPSTFDEFMRYYHANSTERKEIQKEREATEKERVEKIKRGEQGEKALKDLKREAFRDHVERKMNNEKVKEDLYIDLEVSHAANKAINEAFEKGQIYVAPPQPPLPPPESLDNDDIRIDADALAAAARDAAIPADETSNVVVEHKTLGTVIVGAGTSTEDRATIERMRDNDRRGNSDEFDQRTELEPATSGEVNELAHQLGIHRKAPPQPPSLRPLEEITEESTEEFFYSAEGSTKFVSPPPAPYPPSPPLDGVSPPPLPFPPPMPQPPFYNCSEDNACPPPAPMAPDQPPAPPLNASERIVPLHETFQEQAEDLLKKSYGEDGRGVGVALAADLAEGVADAPADDTVGSTDDEDRLDLDAVDSATKASLGNLEILKDAAIDPLGMLAEGGEALIQRDLPSVEAIWHAVAANATPAWLGATRTAFDDFRRIYLAKPSLSSEWIFAQAATLMFAPTRAVQHLTNILADRIGYDEERELDRAKDAELYADVPYRWPRFPTVGILAIGGGEMLKRGGISQVGARCVDQYIKKKCDKDTIAIKDVEKKGGKDKDWRNVAERVAHMFKNLGPESMIQNLKMKELTNKKGGMKMKVWEQLKVSRCDLTEHKGDMTPQAAALRKKYRNEARAFCFSSKDFVAPARALYALYGMTGYRIVSDDPIILNGLSNYLCPKKIGPDTPTCELILVGRPKLDKRNAPDDPLHWDFEKIPKMPRQTPGAGKRAYDAWMHTHGSKFSDGDISQRWAAALHLLRGADALVGVSRTAKLPLLLMQGRHGTMPPYIMLDAPPPRMYPPCYDRGTARPMDANKLATKAHRKFCAQGTSHRSYTLIEDCASNRNGATCRDVCQLSGSEDLLQAHIDEVNAKETGNKTEGRAAEAWSYPWGVQAEGMNRNGVYFVEAVAKETEQALTASKGGKRVENIQHGRVDAKPDIWYAEQTKEVIARGPPAAPTDLHIIDVASAKNITSARWKDGRLVSPMHGGYAVLGWNARSTVSEEELRKADLSRYEVEIASEPCEALAAQRAANEAALRKAARKKFSKKLAAAPLEPFVNPDANHPCQLRPPQHVLNCEPYDGPDCEPTVKIANLAVGPRNMYAVRVRSLNQAGYSPWSRPVSFELPAVPPFIEEAPRVVEHTDSSYRELDKNDGTDLGGAMLTGGAVSSLRKRGFGLRVDVSYAKAIENGEPAIEAEVVLTIGTGADSVDFDEENNPSSEHSNVLGQSHPQPTSHQVDVGKMGTTLRSSHLTVGPSTTTMGDLIPGALYVARVRYRSESGWGPFSPPTEYRAPTATELANRKGGGGVGKHFKAPSLGRSPPAPWPPRAPEGTSLSMAIPDELKSWAQGKSPEGGFVSEDQKEGRRFSLISRGRDALLNYRRNP